MKKKLAKQPTHRPPVTDDEQSWMFSAVIRNPAVFAEARLHLTEEHFGDNEQWLLLIWNVVRAYYAENNCLPTKMLIVTGCNAQLDLSSDGIAEGDEQKITMFLRQTFHMQEEDLPFRAVMLVLRRFLEDRLVDKVHAEFSKPQMPIALPQVFAKMSEQATSLANLTAGALPAPFEEGWDATTSIGERFPTHLPFVDQFLAGGAAPGESYALLGPYGGGKTTLGVMLSAAAASAEFQRWKNSGKAGVPGRAYHFHYEASGGDMQLQSLTYLAEIPRKQLGETIHSQDYSTFSRTGDYKPYEEVRFKRQLSAGVKPPGEFQRFSRAREVLNLCWRPIDMTGVDKNNPDRGCGMVDEIAATIRGDLARSGGSRSLVVVVDYVMEAVTAHFQHQRRNRREIREVLQGWSLEIKRKVASSFNCSVWSLQQLNPEANAAKPGYLPKMTDTPECRSFAQNFDFCFVIGLPTGSGQVLFCARKHRRTDQQKPIVLTLRGDLARFEDASKEWVVDDRTGVIVRREDEVIGAMPIGRSVYLSNGRLS